MAEISPYATPEASLGNNNEEKYQPKLLAFHGRIGRLRYLAYSFGSSMVLVAGLVLVGLVAQMLAALLGPTFSGIIMGIVLVIYYIGLLVISVMFMKRRLNDLDKSGWWALLMFVPFLNLVFAIYILFFPGTKGSNRFGPAQVENTTGIKLFAIVIPFIFFAISGIIAAVAIPAYQDYVKKAQDMQIEQGQ